MHKRKQSISPSWPLMTNTAADLSPTVGTLANENGCCSYRNVATDGIVIKLASVWAYWLSEECVHSRMLSGTPLNIWTGDCQADDILRDELDGAL